MADVVQQSEPETVVYTLDNAPVDDEPFTDEERAAVERAKSDVANGRVLTTAELIHALGL